MRLKSKRLISLLLAGSMMVSMVPAGAVTAFAAETKNIAVMAADSDVAEPVSLSVTVNAGESLETAVKNAAQSENKNWENITNLTVTTAEGKELDSADFQFLSGVVVDYTAGYRYSAKAVNPTNNNDNWKYTGEAFDWLSNLKVLDLTDATCENNAIPPRAFQYNSNITKVFLPENLNRTYLHAFSTMENLEYLGTKSGNLCFPNTMTIMGEGMLYEDTKISGSLSLPASLTAIGAACFQNTQISGDVVIPGNVNISVNTDLGKDGTYGTSDYTFHKTKITSLTLEDGVKNEEIGNGFASECADLTTVSIPKSIHKIGEYAFAKTKLQSLPDLSNVTSLGASAFREITTDGIPGDITINCETVGDSALRGIKINGNVTINSDTIGQYILYNSTVNGNLTINSNTIGSQTLRNTTINGTLTVNTKNPTSELLSYAKINNGLVVGSENIPRSFIPNVTDTQYDATNRIGGPLVLESGVQTVGDSAFNAAGITGKLVLPEGLQTIGGSAFRHNQFSGTIVIPESVKKIGAAAFSFVGGGASTSATAEAKASERKVDTIIVENPDIELEQYAFANQKNGVKIYFTRDVQNTNNNRWGNDECIILNTDGGTIANCNGEATAELDTTTSLYTPTKNGYKFVGWYDANDNKLTTVAETGKTYHAEWYKYNVAVDAEEKADNTTTNYVGSPVDIAVNVTAEDVDVSSIHKADLIFDDINAVEKVEVNGKTLSKPYTNIDLGSLNNSNAEQDIATMAMVHVTTEPVILRVTLNKPGEHRMKIVLKDNLNNVVCASEDTTVTVKGKPIDWTPIEKGYYKLTLTDCAATLDDGTEVKSGESAYVQADKTVTLKLTASMDNMKFNGFVLDPQQDSLKYIDDTTATFTMPSEPVSVTVNLQPEESDDSMDAAAVVTGVALGTGTAILAYHIGTEVYAEQVLGKGVAIPRTHEEVALKAWELAGKPAVELNGEPLSEAAQAEK